MQIPGVVKLRVWPVSKHILPLFIGAACLWLLRDRLSAQTLGEIIPAIKMLPMGQWIAAIAATCVSFWALGRYDVVIHRHFATGCPDRQASVVGAASIAVGQLIGMGVLTGALVRWRMLPEISLVQASKIAATVAMSFFIGLGLIVAVVSLILPVPYALPGLATAFIGGFIILLLASMVNPFRRLSHWHLPTLPAITSIAGLTFLDTTAAAFALYLLMPETAGIGFSLLLPAYLVALSAALITGTPGGVGPFELTLLALLPQAPEADVMAGIVAFRLVYYALPALIAAIILCRPFEEKPAQAAAPSLIRPGAAGVDFNFAARSELGVCRQNKARLLPAGTARLAVVSTPQAEIALFDPLMGGPGFAPDNLFALAKSRNKAACLYKASARYAAHYRRSNLKILHIADEAVIDPCQFSTDGAPFRQLRRKLNKARKSGVTISRAHDLPIRDMARIDHNWQLQNGPARGISVGRFCLDYLRRQRIYIAAQGADLVGFISLHRGQDELCLDLMRADAKAPDGTMHLLIMAAIEDAAQEGRTRLSLAALPPVVSGRSWLGQRRAALIANLSGGAGLTQFKTCFKPRREPLYAAAKSWPALALSLLDLALAIRRPDTNPAQNHHEENAFAKGLQT